MPRGGYRENARRPTIDPSEAKRGITKTFRLHKDLIDKVKQYATEHEITLNKAIAEILLKGLGINQENK